MLFVHIHDDNHFLFFQWRIPIKSEEKNVRLTF